MKQLLQYLDSGKLVCEEVPCPTIKDHHLLVETQCSLISPGTERMLRDFARSSYFAKARKQPERLKELVAKLKSDGLRATLDAVRRKLAEPLPLGYSNVGRVLALGDGVQGFRLGDRVLSNGPHAEVVLVPELLCARIPDQVSDEEASFTVLGATALQGLRLLNPSLGESFAVIGLGPVGLLAVKLLRAAGARVLAGDINAERVELARRCGAETLIILSEQDFVSAARSFSGTNGVDGVLIATASNKSSIMHQAAQICRQRGRIVLTGVSGLELRRSDFYKKELSFQVSCAYGPGRYDPNYEGKAQDYPLPFVRWTAKRNFETVLALLANKQLSVSDLISAEHPLEQAIDAYAALDKQSSLGVLLRYPAGGQKIKLSESVLLAQPHLEREASPCVCGVIGAGAFAQAQLLPALARTKAFRKWLVSRGGTSAGVLAKRFSFERAGSQSGEIFADREVNTVFILTRHNSHAELLLSALRAGKNVFVEKPLCRTEEELKEICVTYQQILSTQAKAPLVMVDFNRRFSPLVRALSEKLAQRREPLALHYLCNAGPLPNDHWLQDPLAGGGRVLGEACHFIDLLAFLVGSPINSISAVGQNNEHNVSSSNDSVIISLSFADGSLGSISYFTSGHRAYPKEKLSVFSEGRVLELDNYRRLQLFGFGPLAGKKLFSQDKGHCACVQAFVTAVEKGAESPIPWSSIVESTRATLAAVQSLREEQKISLLERTPSSAVGF